MDGNKVSIRPATPVDLATIAAIQAASPEASQWEPGDYLEHDCVVAVAEGRVTGFLSPWIGSVVDRVGFAPVCVVLSAMPLVGVGLLRWTVTK